MAISNLVARYPELIDAGDFAGVGELFSAATITTDMGSSTSGTAAIARMYEKWTRRYPDNGTPHTKHIVTNLIVDVDDEAGTGSCRSYYTVVQSTPTFPLQPIITGRYQDTFVRVEGEWRYATRHVITDYVGDLSQHLLQSFT